MPIPVVYVIIGAVSFGSGMGIGYNMGVFDGKSQAAAGLAQVLLDHEWTEEQLRALDIWGALNLY